ncbi:MAG: (d)CMP kinase [Intestinimonas sp.]|jgi:cytidylate kinase|nr:(d)CMP kinase [Intestinimonas sp.]
MLNVKSIAIDGPSGAGKSTLAKRLAEALGFRYVDTGAIYRTLGLMAFRKEVAPENASAVAELLYHQDIRLDYDKAGAQHMYLDGEDVTDEIRRPEVSRYASGVSAIPAVRNFLLSMQRDLAKMHNVIMDGRDIGTVVLPNADVKIFLTASQEDRARRRYEDLRTRGMDTPYEQVLADMIERDHRDSTRETAPLRQAEDAVLVDTTGQQPDESYAVLLEMIRRKLDA